jgi:hypothetical protein
VKASIDANGDHILIYHPNAYGNFYENEKKNGTKINLDKNNRAGFRIDLTQFSGSYLLHWYRPRDGLYSKVEEIRAGQVTDLLAPWKGEDVIAYFEKTDIGLKSNSNQNQQ